MNNFDNIETLWKAPQSLNIPAADAIIKKAEKEKNQVANKLLAQCACLIFSVAVISYIVYKVNFEYLSSYIGIAIIFICIVAFSAIRFMQAQFLRKADFSQSPTILLQQFEAFHKKQQWINTKGVIWYTIILNIAFAFYFYETVILAPFTNFWKLFILFVYIVWMLIATFWLGKKSVKKEHEKVNAIIEKIKQLKEGLQ
jgi:hypothetical protein